MRIPAQDRLDDPALHAGAASVYDADLPISLQQRLVEILFHKIGRFVRPEGMKIDGIFNRQFYGFPIVHLLPALQLKGA